MAADFRLKYGPEVDKMMRIDWAWLWYSYQEYGRRVFGEHLT